MSESAEWRRKIETLTSRRKTAQESHALAEEDLKKAKESWEFHQKAQAFLQDIASKVQNDVHRQLARAASKCLSAVFEKPYELRVEFDKKRGKTEARFVYLRNGRKMHAFGGSGGVRDVTSLALRITSLTMCLPPARKFLCLDEPFKGVSEKNLPKMTSLIERLNGEMGVQFLIATHDPSLQVGEVIQIGE